MIEKPIISIIVAHANNRVIGKNNKMPWGKLKEDLKFFKEKTNGNTVIMGRKTYDSIGNPLPNRRNIIITRNKNLKIKNCEIVNSIEEALKISKNEKEVFIIGGGKIYEKVLPLANKLYITEIKDNFEGETYFPEYKNLNLELNNMKTIFKNEENPYNLIFNEYTIKKN